MLRNLYKVSARAIILWGLLGLGMVLLAAALLSDDTGLLAALSVGASLFGLSISGIDYNKHDSQ
ncbi:MAG TPA: hypothetical protein VEB40_09245 [Flavipsychrobacter sp.]|nr:hypothetical protein [Flavipsychrobacter sp.]